MTDDSTRVPPFVVVEGDLHVVADALLTSPARVGLGLRTLPFIYLPQQGDRGPLVAYVAIEDAIRWLEREAAAGRCPSCTGDGDGLGLLDVLKTRYRQHLDGDSKEDT
jgi:hypothetical protein